MKSNALIAFATVLQSNDILTHLDLSNIYLPRAEGDISLHLSKMIKQNTSLTDLRLAKMGICDWSIVNLLAPALKSNTRLRKLDLSWLV
jgi:hypothetical protein